MTTNELKQIQLYRQHLTNKTDKISVARDLNGLQCQFMVNAFHSLKIRCREAITTGNFGDGLVKSWTIRGTVHVFAEEDLSLFKHKGENSDYLSDCWNGYVHHITRDWTLTPERQKYFADFIVKKVAEGVCSREDLKQACLDNGMTKSEHDSMFDQWGGGLRELCERGFLCYKVQEKKEFSICPPFQPMETSKAILEQARRYFTNFAPATIKDTAYYFGWTQTLAKDIMSKLTLEQIKINIKTYFYSGDIEKNYPDIPRCILLAGFDQLMLGYNKKESIYLPQEYLRGIFNLAGIVMPAILLDGNVAGRWRNKNSKMIFELFKDANNSEKKSMIYVMEQYFSDIKKVEFTRLS
jgi:hypothetical protein